MEKDGYAHVDIANQISNSWNKDSVLGIREGNIGFTIKIRSQDKKLLKKKFAKPKNTENKKYNFRLSTIIHSFLLFKLLSEYGRKFPKAKVCNDTGSFSHLNRYYSKICKLTGDRPLTDIKPRRGDGKSHAHKLVNQTLRGRIDASYTIRERDFNTLKGLIVELIKV
jgi:hypothetical protein